MIIGKSQKMQNVRYDIRGPISDEADRLEREGISIIRLNTGNPAAFGFDAPESILDAIGQLAGAAAPYSSSKGLTHVREAIAAYSAKMDIPNVSPDDVYTGNGVSELIQISLQAFLNPGDEVLIPTPDYPLWTAATILAGGTAVHYMCDESADWYPDIDDLKSKITPRTRGIVVISPNNPTGSVYPKELLNEIAMLAREHQLVLFSDEIYDRLIMDDKEHYSISSLAPDLLTIVYNGLSKSHQICGYRAGWMVLAGDKSGAGGYIEGLNVLSSLRLCSNVTGQSVICAALDDLASVRANVSPGGRLYEQREYAYTALSSIPGISAVKPKAALYIFPKIDIEMYNIENDEKFVLDFLREKHVLLTHGGSYNWKKPDHFRVAYLPKMDELVEVIARLSDFLQNYQQV
ncbi:MAG: pyridoxal phosphate-dependent aminotransferase [Oscillospiraceae bacterium]|nr:pyridoxal phosphate-dependent aminotransferase [Oscillospiraceae bacterium]